MKKSTTENWSQLEKSNRRVWFSMFQASIGKLFGGQCQLRANTINTRACFLSLARSKLMMCSANHRAGYFSNLACDWMNIVRAYSEQETDNRPRRHLAHWSRNQRAFPGLPMTLITLTSYWARWRLKWRATRLFTQPFIQAQIKNITAPRHWPLCGEFTGDRWIPRTNGR